MPTLIDFNADWLFEGKATVTLPHTAVELPFSYFDEREYQRVFTYEKRFIADPNWDGQEISLQFDGAMANAEVSLNGTKLGGHADGYTPFDIRLTNGLKAGENVITVKIDGSENPGIPPFGGVIDYLTYAGIYREVWLKVAPKFAIANVKIETHDVMNVRPRVTAKVFIANPEDLPLTGHIEGTIISGSQVIASTAATLNADELTLKFDGLENIALWEIDNPALYTLNLKLTSNHGVDETATRFGFRSAEFTPEGFKLNGRSLKLLGLNRHQSFPYAGYAMGKTAQHRDAEILKNELKLNMVRTSHYPQATSFLERCDELGLLVFEEIPGWQHIGDKAWQAASIDNVRAMITRDWNHPSIVIWGVRINESQDNHDFYVETNRLARELDATRPTGGVRFITDSELLEDVYTMNDFILGQEELGGNRPRTPLRDQREVTGLDRVVPYMITEFGGHMYPTKSHDQEQRQAEQVTRHLEVL
ncbi:MAG: glycoside hydrolase family 2 TIM barrel-domain containing protein, partial [Deltaproteobacteria bacterium]